MRPLKFKAWDKELKKWSQTPMTYAIEDLNFYTDYEWCQYTGLKDKHGTEIYEGDLVRYDAGIECGTFRVEFDAGGFEALWLEHNFETPTHSTTLKYLQCSQELEVIGNCFETQ